MEIHALYRQDAGRGIIMFDSIGVFQRQFTPVEGGYAYYPSRKGGAKFVSPEEYAALVARWQRVAGRRGMWTSTGVIMAIIIVWVTLSEWLTLPDWTQNVMTTACVVGPMAWIYYASFAPRRLVRGAAGYPAATPDGADATGCPRDAELAFHPVFAGVQRADFLGLCRWRRSQLPGLGLDARQWRDVCPLYLVRHPQADGSGAIAPPDARA
jgi:hypothetical protein